MSGGCHAKHLAMKFFVVRDLLSDDTTDLHIPISVPRWKTESQPPLHSIATSM